MIIWFNNQPNPRIEGDLPVPTQINRDDFFMFISSIWKTSKLYEEYFQSTIEDYGLSKSEKDILLFLRNNPQFRTATDIVKYRSISKSLVSKSVESLIGKGYLTEEQSSQDKRYTYLALTPEATPLVDQLSKVQSDFFHKFSNKISQEEFAQCKSIHQKIIDGIEEGLEKNE